jgi:hypothetical protein
MIIYRCATCGKWSHAQSKPKTHQRWVRDEGTGDGFPQSFREEDVIEYIPAFYGGHEGVDYMPGGWKVRCGPFDIYEAVKQ